MTREIVITTVGGPPIDQHEIEMCEHKGVGHPDTITDAVCEAASRELSLAYLNTCGKILHHNLDKGLLVAGKTMPRFGGGNWVKPIKLIVCGRATRLDSEVDIHHVVTSAVRHYLAKHIRCDGARFEIVTEIDEGSSNLKAVFANSSDLPLASDTSFGVGFAPYSRLEQAVLALSRTLASSEFRQLFPAAGDDFKIMGYRLKDQLNFTIALAMIDKHVPGIDHYFAIKQSIHEHLIDKLGTPAKIRLNVLDNPGAQDESGVYLTVSGLSAEMGDDGQVGRGNRVNGLITPSRTMSLEAAAGKNPASHVGKIYNVLAMLMARDIYEQIEEVEEVNVQLLSAIGQTLDQPQVVSITVVSKQGITHKLREAIAAIVEGWLSSIVKVTHVILEEKVALY